MEGRTVVVGGGVMGAAIAWRAALRADPLRAPVVLLERTELAAGSSGRSGAILRQFYSDAPLVAMARDALGEYASFEARTGRAIGFQRQGVLTIAGAGSRVDRELVERNADLMRGLGVAAYVLDAAAVRALVPGIEIEDGAIACHEPDGGALDPVRTVHAFAALAREEGAITRLGVACTGFEIERGRLVGVRTADGVLEAARAVVAGGPWSGPLLAAAGVPLPLHVVRPAQQFVEPPPARGKSPDHSVDPLLDSVLDRLGVARSALPPPAHPVLLDLERGFYTRCEGHAARTRIGRLDHERDIEVADPDRVDERVDPEFTRWARAALEARMPIYRARAERGTSTGMYTLTPDSQAAIGPTRVAGLYVATGFSGHGFKLAPQVGEGVAQMLAGETVRAFDAAFFDPARFERAGAREGGRGFGL